MRHKTPLLPASPRRQLFKDVTLPQLEINIVATTEHWVIVEKPAGILSVPGRHQGISLSVAEQIALHFPQAQGNLVVHRLDLSTSGLMIFALHTQSLKALQALFAKRLVKKRYTALVSKQIHKPQGEIYLPLRLDPYQRPLQVYDPVHGKACHTSWQRVKIEGGYSRVLLYPHTGRTHQLRVHMAHPLGLHAAIVGDPLYHVNAPVAGIQQERLCLHASFLQFQDPITDITHQFESLAPF